MLSQMYDIVCRVTRMWPGIIIAGPRNHVFCVMCFVYVVHCPYNSYVLMGIPWYMKVHKVHLLQPILNLGETIPVENHLVLRTRDVRFFVLWELSLATLLAHGYG